MSSPHHPVWFLLNLMAVAIFVTVFSYINASEFDETEGKTIMSVIGCWAAYEGGKAWLRSKSNQGKT